MNHLRLMLAAGLTLLLALSLAVPVTAQADLNEACRSEDGGFSFLYPEGWHVVCGRALSYLSDDDITLYFASPSRVADVIGGTAVSDVNTTLIAVLDALEIDYTDAVPLAVETRRSIGILEALGLGNEAIAETKLDGREVAIAAITLQGETGIAFGLRFKDGGIGVVLAYGSEAALAEAEATLMAIVSTFDSLSLANCTVRTTDERTVSLRVGPGTNRSPITFLPANQDFSVLGKAQATDGNWWWKLDKAEVAPHTAATELWVAQDDVTPRGDCDMVDNVDVPPVVPFRPEAREESTATLIIISNQPDWVNSGITVSAGQSFTIEADGSMNPCLDTYPNGATYCVFYTPQGGRNVVPYQGEYGIFPGPGLRFMALLGRIGDGEPFYVGAGGTFTAEQAGTLWFTPNDNLRTDNRGAYNALVWLGA